jgi:hypothetical protein
MKRGIRDKQQFLWSPDRSLASDKWLGSIKKKPWDYKCEVVIPVLDTPDLIPICVDLLRLQYDRPYIVIVDTGSTPENFNLISQLASEDVEVHSIRLNSVRHPSDYVAIAMDLGMSLCRTDYMFCTHADCFLTSRSVITELLEKCNKNNPAVGYRLTERAHSDWAKMVSHTCTMLHIPTMDKIGAGWSLRRLCNKRKVNHVPNILGANWPDTEILLNYILWEHGIQAELIGTEENHARNKDHRIDHVRSVTAGRLYSKHYTDLSSGWLKSAVEEAQNRIKEWRLQ